MTQGQTFGLEQTQKLAMDILIRIRGLQSFLLLTLNIIFESDLKKIGLLAVY